MPAEVVGKDDRLLRRVTCANCCSILQYAPCDRCHTTYTDYSGETDRYYYIPCPECGKKAAVPE